MNKLKEHTNRGGGIRVDNQLTEYEVVVSGSMNRCHQRSDSERSTGLSSGIGWQHESWRRGRERSLIWVSSEQEVGRSINQQGGNWPSAGPVIRSVYAEN